MERLESVYMVPWLWCDIAAAGAGIMVWWLWLVVICSDFVTDGVTGRGVGLPDEPRTSSDHGGSHSHALHRDVFRDECMSPLLTCVPEDNCVAETKGGYHEGWKCPPNWVEWNSLCVLLPDTTKVEERTQAQVVEYCTAQGALPYYFQNSQEMQDFLQFGIYNKKDDRHYKSYWLDARWDDNHDRWEWLSTGQEIEWGKLLRGNCSSENLEVIDKEDGCLGMSLDIKSGCIRIRKISCLIELPFFCKMGIYESRCAESSVSDCCYSSTYNYYNKNKFGGPGSHTIHGTTKSECWILLQHKTQPIPCHEALDIVGVPHSFPRPVRIGNSFFYFTSQVCLGERLAVVATPKIHLFITSFMMSQELVLNKVQFVIGLNYDYEEDEFHWENGKTIDYYNHTYWSAGQPDKQAGANYKSCVAYVKTGRNSYTWHLLPYRQCSGEYTINICELPIRATNVMPTAKKVECGQRLERGVLARSSYGGAEHDDEDSLYGEFPWHVAVLQPSNYLEGVVMVFSCSGALVHPQFVVTSAHCVVYSGTSDFAVSLGEWDLAEDAVQVLDTQLVTVSDVIIHPGYKATGSMMHDVALLQLDENVDVDSYPHVGLGCLPFPRLFYQQSIAWECFTVGWPNDKDYDKHHKHSETRVLQRIESDFVGRRQCRHHTRTYYNTAHSHRQHPQGYDKKYGYHHLDYEHHQYFEYSEPELMCTEPYESSTCLGDSTPILVCRKASLYTDDPFNVNHYGQSYGRRAYTHSSVHNKIKISNSRIINAYGDDRFDSDQWYVMGVGHTLNCDGGKGYGNFGRRSKKLQVFTPLHEYLSFIHSHLDLQTNHLPPTPY